MGKTEYLDGKCPIVNKNVSFSAEYESYPEFPGFKISECTCDKNHICGLEISRDGCPNWEKARQLQD